MSGSLVALSRCADYSEEALKRSIDQIFSALGGVAPLKSRGERILLKPNMLMSAHPDEAVTTHPALFAAVASYLIDHGFTVTAGDSPAVESTISVAEKCGIAAHARKLGVPIVDFKEMVSRDLPEGRIIKKMQIARAVAEADTVISLPKLKTHTQMYYTGAIKNLFGSVAGLEKSRYHVRFVERKYFARMICDIFNFIKPAMSIIDAVVSMEGHGPRNGTPKFTGFVSGSFDTCALDIVCSRIIGYDPLEIPIIAEEVKRRGGEGYVRSIVTAGVSEDELRPESFELIKSVTDIAFLRKSLPKFVYNLIRNAALPAPDFNANCVLCRKCVKICSADALKFNDGKGKRSVGIELNRCVRCYCCHEVCAYNAIDLKRHFRF